MGGDDGRLRSMSGGAEFVGDGEERKGVGNSKVGRASRESGVGTEADRFGSGGGGSGGVGSMGEGNGLVNCPTEGTGGMTDEDGAESGSRSMSGRGL